jgi:hypothetical protein
MSVATFLLSASIYLVYYCHLSLSVCVFLCHFSKFHVDTKLLFIIQSCSQCVLIEELTLFIFRVISGRYLLISVIWLVFPVLFDYYLLFYFSCIHFRSCWFIEFNMFDSLLISCVYLFLWNLFFLELSCLFFLILYRIPVSIFCDANLVILNC